MKILIFAACMLVTTVIGSTVLSTELERYHKIYKNCCKIVDCTKDKYAFLPLYCTSVAYDVFHEDGTINWDGISEFVNIIDDPIVKAEVKTLFKKCMVIANKEKDTQRERAQHFITCVRPVLDDMLHL